MLPFFGLTLSSAYRVSLQGKTVNANGATPTNVTAGFRLGADGKVYRARTQVGGGAYEEVSAGSNEWLDPHDGVAADAYECQATVTAGALTSGTAGSWLALTSDREWEVTRTNDVLGTDTCTFTLEIRRIGTTVVLNSASITLNAEVT